VEPITYEDKSSTVIPRTPMLLRNSGVLTTSVLYTGNHTNSQNIHKENTPNSVQSNLIMNAQIDLESVLYADTKIYIPNISCGKVVKVYDADTITVANRISVGGAQSDEIYRFQVRLNGIDSPEIKSKNPHTKELAKQARVVLSDMIFGKIVELKNVQFEKYGRLLADVYLGDLHLNQWLIEHNYAVRYDGGTKQIPEDWV
jgi:micrococcal nuclease